MKKLSLALVAFFMMAFTFSAFASEGAPAPKKASEIFFNVGSTGERISLQELSTISREELELRTGKKMNFGEKIAFKKAQKKLNKGIDEDGNLTSKKLKKAFADGESGFHLGGFALGFLVGLIGVVIAYIINDDYKRNRVKWAWIGFGAAVAISVALVLLVL